MAITRATNLAGLGTVFDALTDGGGLSISGISTFTDLNVTRVNVTGVSTFSSNPVLIGSATSTGTASQRLQVTGGAYVSGSVGIGTTNPIRSFHLFGNGTASEYVMESVRTTSSADNKKWNFVVDADLRDTTRNRFYIRRLNDAANGGSEPFMITGNSEVLINGSSVVSGYASTLPLQVTGGAYVSGSVGIGNTDPDKPFVLKKANPGNYIAEISNTQNSFDANGLYVSTTNTAATTRSLNVQGSLIVTGEGNVGIATDNPLAKLDSRGTVLIATNANGNNLLAFGNSSSFGPLTGAPNGSHGNAFILGNSSTASGAPGYLSFWTTTGGVVSEAARIHSTGEVSIGSTIRTGTASQRLQVTGGAYVSGSVGIGTTNPGATIDAQSSTATRQDGGLGRFLAPSMNVGADNSIAIGRQYSAAVSTWQAGLIAFYYDGVNSASSNSYLGMNMAGRSNQIIIHSNDNVGIATTIPGSKLDVYAQDGNGVRFGFPMTRNTTGTRNLAWGKDTNQQSYFFTGIAGLSTGSSTPSDAIVLACSPTFTPSAARIGVFGMGCAVFNDGAASNVNPGLKSVMECYTNTNLSNTNNTGGYLRWLTKPDNGSLTVGMQLSSAGVVTKPIQPSFLAYTTGFSKTAGTWEKITLATEEYDIAGNYDAANSRFTAPVAGRYLFFAGGFSTTASTGHDRYAFMALVNGGGLFYFSGGNYSAIDSPLTGYCAVYNLSASDYVEVYGFSAIAATWGGSTHKFFWGGYLLG